MESFVKRYGIYISADKSIHIFSDASEKATTGLDFLNRLTQIEVVIQVLFYERQSCISSRHTNPRLELCVAVLAVEIAKSIADHLDTSVKEFRFYTDNKIVLGYINHTSRRSYTYVTNRVALLQKSTAPEQWRNVPSEKNPADKATRSIPSYELNHDEWMRGPRYLIRHMQSMNNIFVLPDLENDKEVRAAVSVLNTNLAQKPPLGFQRFERFSIWRALVETSSRLEQIAKTYRSKTICKGWHICQELKTVNDRGKFEIEILKDVQADTFSEELCNINKRQ